ncbi:MAG: hypothetical protein HY787_20860, partial [Deltaproteobacteria bacterium]|nr:hypothetical protein [Deltaproteobacteria bacterium]
VPEYYSDSMDLSVVIDRGDVWYDFPFDEKGRRLTQAFPGSKEKLSFKDKAWSA